MANGEREDQYLFWSIAETGKRLGISTSMVKILLGRGAIKSGHIGRRHLVYAESARQFAQSRVEAAE